MLLIGEVCVGKVEVAVERGMGARLDVELIECAGRGKTFNAPF